MAVVALLQGTDEPVSYSRDVKPILSDRCYTCHGPDPETREAGLRLDTREGALAVLGTGGHAIVPGDLDESELSYRLDAEFEDELMPPPRTGKPLSADEIALLRRWIVQGAGFEPHWSFAPPTRRAEPVTIDGAVAAKLDAAGLAMQPRADASVLLRRVSLDLTGLPPTPEERRAFLLRVERDGFDAAYADEVDRLLASPRYGVHMARPWLDAARYADTHGLHLDNRRSMWPYRDWVVDALNDNVPFDRFTVEQLAGDLLPEPTQAQLIASGFNRCNPTSAEGGMIAEEYLSIYAKDRVDTVSTVWLGLTVACAQCHDHKYDPITQRDYYRMVGFFNSLDEEASDRNVENPRPFLRVKDAEQEAGLEKLDAKVLELDGRIDGPWPDLEARMERWIEGLRAERGRRWRALTPEDASATAGAELAIERATGIVTAGGGNPDRTVYTLEAFAQGGAIEGLRLDALAPEGVDVPGRAVNHNFVLSKVEVLAGPAGSEERFAVPLAEAAATHSQPDYGPAGVLDDDPNTGWAGLRHAGDRSLFLSFARSVGFEEGTELRVRLHFDSVHRQHSLARLRLAVRRTEGEAASLRTAPMEYVRVGSSPDDALAWAAREDVNWAPRPDLVEGRVHAFDAEVGTHFMRTTLRLERAATVDLFAGSDDELAIWLDGELVHDNPTRRGVAMDQDRVRLELERGGHELLFRVINAGGASGFAYRLAEVRSGPALPLALEVALDGDDDAEPSEELVRAWRAAYAPEWKALVAAREVLMAERQRRVEALPTTLVSRERAERRPAHVLMRGAYDAPGEEVQPGTPAALPPMPEGAPADRLGLARWLVSPDNPLTARVWVNRAWQHFFGTGLVATPEDFGSQGALPTHPELLDALALDFVAGGWDMKAMHRRIVMSGAYTQSSAFSDDALRVDPDGTLLSRGPRHRLDGEVIRDSALFVAGLLDEVMGGPGVYPYQPDGVWFAVGYSGSNTVRYTRGPADHLHRRSLYTFWKRTAPPPNLTAFDAPMRDMCVVRRERTNTPLQALVTLNDPTYVEAARFTAGRVLREQPGAAPEELARALLERVLAKDPSSAAVREIAALATELEASYRAAPDDARALLAVGELPAGDDLEPARHAAWTLAASAAANLDDALTKH